MSRPQGLQAGKISGNIVDALVCAHRQTTIERNYAAADLPRLREAGARDGSAVAASFHFVPFDGRVAIEGELGGVAVLTCQRCMQAVEVPLRERFKVIVVQEEAELEQEPGGYEPILTNPAHLDLQMLAEDQALLALPLVPRHESDKCNEAQAASPAAGPGGWVGAKAVGAKAVKDDAVEDGDRSRPFGNLRDLMRKR